MAAIETVRLRSIPLSASSGIRALRRRAFVHRVAYDATTEGGVTTSVPVYGPERRSREERGVSLGRVFRSGRGQKMLTRVVRAITRWSDTLIDMVADGGMTELAPLESISGWYVPSRDEPLVSMIVPADIADHLQLLVRLHRFERAMEILLGPVPAVTFAETQRNRFAFHGTVDERDSYEIQLSNISVRSVCVTLALLVDQP